MDTPKYIIQRSPFQVPTTDGKTIMEHFGLASKGDGSISVAHMKAPAGWSEPFQTPEFDEYTLILCGRKQFNIDGQVIILEAGESIFIRRNVKVQYANPFPEECEYIAICMPAFSPETVHREA